VNQNFLNDREIQILMVFKKVSDTVMGKISADIEEATGLSGVEFGVLLRIEELGPAPIRQQGLAESLEWEKSRLSHLLTRMEGRGLVKRKADGPKNTTVFSTRPRGLITRSLGLAMLLPRMESSDLLR
jgi:hypothetical protein